MITKNIKDEIKEYFFTNPSERLRVRHIERMLKLPLPSVIRYCRELEKEGLLRIIKTGNVVFYTADRSNENFLLEKKLFNIKQLHNSGLVKHIKIELHNPPVIVFGSYSKGEDVENSDIDLYIETTKKGFDLRKFEKILKRRVQLFIHTNINDVRNPHLANNIINGIGLNGFIEAFQ